MALREPSAKLKHLDAACAPQAQARLPRGALDLRALRFRPRSLPELRLCEVDLSQPLLGRTLKAPLMIAPMTGGAARAGALNRMMAAAAEAHGLAFGLGSQRVGLEDPARAADFQVRDVAPSVPIFSNLGAVQMVKGFSPEDAARAVELAEADALFLHINPMQEVIQAGGDTEWAGVLAAIERLCAFFAARGLVPVFAREVGFGLPRDEALRLARAGVSGFDCAGQGGTSWSRIEGLVDADPARQAMSETFADWGLSTAESILEVRAACPEHPLIATGGLRSGLDVAKAIALGATLGAMAAPVLWAALEGEEALDAFLGRVTQELRAVLFGVGAGDVARFRAEPRLLLPGEISWPEGLRAPR